MLSNGRWIQIVGAGMMFIAVASVFTGYTDESTHFVDGIMLVIGLALIVIGGTLHVERR